ncbi:MAG: hypothetical protein FJ276_16685 [Planctomycetes bacterium]|nr:hypothetical protein [Planctomycetota bacterium]
MRVFDESNPKESVYAALETGAGGAIRFPFAISNQFDRGPWFVVTAWIDSETAVMALHAGEAPLDLSSLRAFCKQKRCNVDAFQQKVTRDFGREGEGARPGLFMIWRRQTVEAPLGATMRVVALERLLAAASRIDDVGSGTNLSFDSRLHWEDCRHNPRGGSSAETHLCIGVRKDTQWPVGPYQSEIKSIAESVLRTVARSLQGALEETARYKLALSGLVHQGGQPVRFLLDAFHRASGKLEVTNEHIAAVEEISSLFSIVSSMQGADRLIRTPLDVGFTRAQAEALAATTIQKTLQLAAMKEAPGSDRPASRIERFSATTESSHCSFPLEPSVLEQTLKELAHNACKYSTKGTIPTFQISPEASSLSLTIVSVGSDKRSPEDRKLATLGRGEGAGQGLRMLARFAELYQNIRVEWEQEPDGCNSRNTFRVRVLPVIPFLFVLPTAHFKQAYQQVWMINERRWHLGQPIYRIHWIEAKCASRPQDRKHQWYAELSGSPVRNYPRALVWRDACGCIDLREVSWESEIPYEPGTVLQSFEDGRAEPQA